MDDIQYVPGQLISPYQPTGQPELDAHFSLHPNVLKRFNIPGADAKPIDNNTVALAAAPVLGYQGVYARLMSTFDGKIATTALVQLGDNLYYLPTVSYITSFLKASGIAGRYQWLEERFDCDDFSYVLKGEMSKTWYKTGAFQAGFCGGLIWGNFSWVEGSHAVNWFLDDGGVVHLIEPQTDKIYEASQCSRVDLLVG